MSSTRAFNAEGAGLRHLPPYTDICRCSPTSGGCGHHFSSTAAFDKHRVGRPGIDRRCRTPGEMLAAGMSANAKGLWVTKPYVAASRRLRHATIDVGPLSGHPRPARASPCDAAQPGAGPRDPSLEAAVSS